MHQGACELLEDGVSARVALGPDLVKESGSAEGVFFQALPDEGA